MNRRNPLLKSLVLLLLSGFLSSACQDASSEPDSPEQDGWASLPKFTNDANCAETPASPDACAWAGSMDAVAIFKIQDIEMADSPSVVADSTQELVDACDGVVNHYLKMKVSLDETLSGEVPSELTVRVGVAHLDNWSPRPTKPENGAIEWLGASAQTHALLEVGQKVGLALHYHAEDQIWSLMGELMFTTQADTSENHIVNFQERGGAECSEPPPEDLQGADLDAFKQAIAACPTEPSPAAIDRRQRVLAGTASRPEAYKSGTCIPTTPR